jgi:hypothetical protein
MQAEGEQEARGEKTMNRPKFKRFIPQIMTALAVASLSVSMAAAAQDAGSAPQDQTPIAAGQRTDGQIEMDVVHALDASQALKNDLITAATIQGEVTLSGTVSTQASKDLAGSIASGVQGVSKVQNNLTVGNPQAAAAAQNLPDDQNAEQEAPEQPQAPPQNEPMPAPDNGQANGAQMPPQAAPAPENQPYPAPNPQARPQYSPYPPPPPQYGQQQPPYGQAPYGQQPQYGYQQPPYPPQPAYQQPSGPVTLTQGTLLQVRTNESVDSKRATDGTPVQFTLIQDVTMGGVLAIPRGATLHGVITEAKQTHSGQLSGHSELALTLTSLDLGGQNYPIQSDEFKVKSPNKAGQTAGSAVTGGLLGTIIGCAAGRGVGCAIGAGAGAAAGTAASAASSGPRAWIPAEALVTFHLATPITVNPVSPQEAARLAQGLYPGGPNLYRRGMVPYGYYGAPAGAYPAYGYPPVYYVPYYTAGGFYYWR